MPVMQDADVLTRGEKGSFDLKSWLAGQPNEQFEVPAITVAELWDGVGRAIPPHKQRRWERAPGELHGQPFPITTACWRMIYALTQCHSVLAPLGLVLQVDMSALQPQPWPMQLRASPKQPVADA